MIENSRPLNTRLLRSVKSMQSCKPLQCPHQRDSGDSKSNGGSEDEPFLNKWVPFRKHEKDKLNPPQMLDRVINLISWE